MLAPEHSGVHPLLPECCILISRTMEVVFLIFAGFALALALLWIIVPALYGLPTVPARRQRVRAALRPAGLQPGEVLYDLGAGDGRVLIIAAREFGARAIGIEIGPVQCLLCWLRLLWGGLSRQVQIERRDFMQADLHRADVVYAYITSAQVQRLQHHLELQLRPGARVVTLACDLSSWQPAAIDRQTLAFLYVMPPVKVPTAAP